ncbi:hypothetical protein LCGC14_1954830 [marine sediment metagenome]|uniref:Hypervirulence associated protein TUDOR domain-containing protein n=1 Tax=marine sediment metagenome TaxID=412755 RepID=A0A0F9HUQ9_9ZZZZ
MEIKLGDKVKDKITGFTGTVVAKTEFLNGCIQYNVMPKGEKSNKMPEDMSIDAQSLEVVKAKKQIKKESNGGKTRIAFKQRGY